MPTGRCVMPMPFGRQGFRPINGMGNVPAFSALMSFLRKASRSAAETGAFAAACCCTSHVSTFRSMMAANDATGRRMSAPELPAARTNSDLLASETLPIR